MALDYYGPNPMGDGYGPQNPPFGLPTAPAQYGAVGIPGEADPSTYGPPAAPPKSFWERYNNYHQAQHPENFQGPAGTMGPPVGPTPPPAAPEAMGPPSLYGPPTPTTPPPPEQAANPAFTPPPGTVTPPGRLSQAQLDAQWDLMVPGESSGNPNAKNPHSTASGLAQFTDATRDRFLASPEGAGLTKEDYKNSPAVQRKAFDWLTQDNNTALLKAGMDSTPESRAVAHALGAGGATALMSAPGENAVKAYDAKVPGGGGKGALITGNAAWGITPTDTAAEASTKIVGYYARNAQSAGGSSGGTQSASSDPSKITPDPGKTLTGSSDAIPAQVGFGPGPLGPNGIPPGMSPDYTPLNPSDKMLAFAGGIGRGKNLADGIGLGIQDMQKLSSDDQEQRYKIMQQAAATNYTNQHALLADAQIPAVGARVEQGNRALDLKGQALDVREQQFKQQQDMAQQRLQVQQTRANTMQENAMMTNNGMRGLTAATVKDSENAYIGLTTDYANAAESQQKIADLTQSITAEGVTGSTAKAQIVRFAAEKLGIDIGVSPSGYSLTSKQITDFNNGSAINTAKGAFSRITQGEFNAIGKGFVNMQTDPQAALAMLKTVDDTNRRTIATGEKWNGILRDPTVTNGKTRSQEIMTGPGGLRGWVTNERQGQNQARGISSDPNTAPVSQYTTGPGGVRHSTIPSADGTSTPFSYTLLPPTTAAPTAP